MDYGSVCDSTILLRHVIIVVVVVAVVGVRGMSVCVVCSTCKVLYGGMSCMGLVSVYV